jgi:hypothetical protein
MHGNITLEESTPFCQETMKDIGALSILLDTVRGIYDLRDL